MHCKWEYFVNLCPTVWGPIPIGMRTEMQSLRQSWN